MQEISDQFAAVHEAGHVTVGMSLPGVMIRRASIVEVKPNRGMTEMRLTPDRLSMKNGFITFAGGMAAEFIVYSRIMPLGSTGDLQNMLEFYKRGFVQLGSRLDSCNFFTGLLPGPQAETFDHAFLLARDLILANLDRYSQVYHRLLREKTVDFTKGD